MSIESLTSTVLRFSGISSGLDTESIVASLTQLDQYKVDKEEQNKTLLEWKADELRSVNLSMKTFRESYTSVLSDISMVSSSTYNAFTVSSSDTSAVTISASSSANTGTMEINSITQLAASAEVESLGIFTTDGDSVKSTALSDLAFSGTALTFDSGEISFSINGETFTFAEDDTVYDLMNEINTSDAGVKMTYSTLKNGFQITSTDTGSSAEIDIQNISGNAFADDATNAAFGIATSDIAGVVVGQDAILQIEGIDVTESSNTFTIDGITYKLNETSTTSIDFTVERDVQSTVDSVLAFIDSYNTLIEDLNDRITEETYSDYSPLTDDQKDEMTDDEIEDWEEYAQSGLLRSDVQIRSTLSKLRSAFYEAVGDTGFMPADIGLETSSDWTLNGQIVVDEDMLYEAIQDNPTIVEELFTGIADDDSTDEWGDSGLAVRIDDILYDHINDTTDNQIASTDSMIEDSEDRIETLEDRLEANESIHWAKFNALEVALSTMNSQASAFAAMLGTSTTSE